MDLTNVNPFIVALTGMIAAATPVILAIIAWRQNIAVKISEKSAALVVRGTEDVVAKAEEVRAEVLTQSVMLEDKLNAARSERENVRVSLADHATQMNERLEVIHRAVNGDRAKLMQRLEEMHAEIVRLNVEKERDENA